MLRRNQPMSLRAHTGVARRIHTALREMCLGRAGAMEFRDLCDAVNIVEVLCDMGKLPRGTLRTALHTAQAGMERAAADIRMNGHAGVSPDQFEALRQLVNAYDGAMARMSAATMENAGNQVIRQIADQRTNPANGVTVVEV